MLPIKVVVPLVIVALCCHLRTGDAQCRTKLSRKGGSFSYPNHRACNRIPSWELRVNRKQSIRFRFSGLLVGNGTLEIRQKKWARQRWVTRHVFNRSVPFADAVIESPYKFALVRAKGIQSFSANYDVFFCPIPGPEVAGRACSDGFNAKFSTCTFQCKSPLYYPRHPDYMLPFNSTCKGSRNWVPEPTLKCMPFSELESICFTQNTNCPFTSEQLNIFFPPDDPELLDMVPKRLVFVPPPLPPLPLPGSTPGGNTTDDVSGRVFPPPVAEARVEILNEWDKICKLQNICTRTEGSSAYVIESCGHFSAELDNGVRRLLCLICRFHYKTCDTLKLFA